MFYLPQPFSGKYFVDGPTLRPRSEPRSDDVDGEFPIRYGLLTFHVAAPD